MEIDGGRAKPKGPYKVCSTWLKEASYIRMVTDFWMSNPPGARRNIINDFMHNLLELKKLSKILAHNKRILDDQSLKHIESDIAAFETNHGGTYRSNEHKDHEEKFFRTMKKSGDWEVGKFECRKGMIILSSITNMPMGGSLLTQSIS